MSLLEIEGLSVTLDAKRVINGLSLTLEAGQTLGLVGESGSGKSMTALAILNLLPEGARRIGAIRLDGEDLAGKSEAAMCTIRGAAIGLIFQEPMTALNPVLTIGRQISETLILHRRLSREEAALLTTETLDRVGLTAAGITAERYPHELSGGQRQRVAIAIAIACSPKLLIADEPTSALDVIAQAEIIDLLQRLVREDGTGLILITHDLALAASTADHIAVMRAGEIVETGETIRLFTTMTHPYTQSLRSESARQWRRRRKSHVGVAPVLEAISLYRGYPRLKDVLKDVSLSIRPGETVGLVGESGSGKSTLARAILALDGGGPGEIRLGGEVFTRDASHLRWRIQAVFQDPHGSFDPRWQVERLIAEPLHLVGRKVGRQERRNLVETMLELVGLAAEDADRLPHEFSGGQRQRLAIARALITEPAVIVLDEPTSALDVSSRAQILDLLADLAIRLDFAYLFVTHDLAALRRIADRVLVMRRGKIIESGPTEQIFEAPSDPYTAALIAATPDLERALAQRQA
jgi:peptide/nickel transport system ATP-binding protein